MKKTLLFIGIGLLSYTYSYSQQNLNNGNNNTANVITTTEEEYNYFTVGYPNAIAQGYDVKQGYSVKDLGTWGYQGQNFAFKAFYRDGVSLPIAILAIYTYTRGATSAPQYYCIPTMNAWNLWQRTLQQVSSETLAGAKYEAFTYALMKLDSEIMTAH
jgi:hypothetical protein